MSDIIHHVDKHVGNRLRLRRTMLGQSQEKLADALNLTYQQVQKYERGVNRISISRLYDIAKILHVPVSFFFEGLDASLSSYSTKAALPANLSAGLSDNTTPSYGHDIDDPMTREETLQLVRAYYRLPNVIARRKFLDLLIAMSHSNPEKVLNESEKIA